VPLGALLCSLLTGRRTLAHRLSPSLIKGPPWCKKTSFSPLPSWPAESFYPPLVNSIRPGNPQLKGHHGIEKLPFPLFHRCQLRGSASRRSSLVNRSSSPLLVDSVHPENPLDLMVLLRSILQLEIHSFDLYTGSCCRRLPPISELSLLCSLLLASHCLMS
jgi:hypothetical protein